MYIVQLTTIAVTCPILVTEDIVKAVEFARSIDATNATAQDVRIFTAAQELPDLDADRAIFSRSPRHRPSRVGGPFVGPLVWEDEWHEASYEHYFNKLAAAT